MIVCAYGMDAYDKRHKHAAVRLTNYKLAQCIALCSSQIYCVSA